MAYENIRIVPITLNQWMLPELIELLPLHHLAHLPQLLFYLIKVNLPPVIMYIS
jgi:hypothetical protein